ncbi:CRT10 [Microdochium nivale]|nr:CRT10 [Microdochium nivale]
MAAAPSSSRRKLHVGRCSCETGRQRHHVLPNTRIPFEAPADTPQSAPAVAVIVAAVGEEATLAVVGGGVTSTVGDSNDSTADGDEENADASENGLIDGVAPPEESPDIFNVLLDVYAPLGAHTDGQASANDAIIGEIDNALAANQHDGNNQTGVTIEGGASAITNANVVSNIADLLAPPPAIFQMLPLLNPSVPTGNVDWQVFDDDDDGSGLGDDASIVDTDSEAPDAASEPDEHATPRIASWRLNLTALSQIYNFYVTAYRDQIHISRPRSCVTSRLPPSADLVLRPRPSAKGVAIGGAVDEMFPHQVNHLIIGDLGCDEILVMAYDDGDVIAYYTRHIEEALIAGAAQVQSSPVDHREGARRTPQPFFHENVGKSAWGLAIHSQSRLIAVGNNLRRVDVFAFALAGQPCASLTSNLADEPPGLFRRLYWDSLRTINMNIGFLAHLVNHADPDTYRYLAAVEASLVRRDANWHLTFDTGIAGHNVPNVTFSSTPNGDADKVVAVDVRGNIWLMDLWSVGSGSYTKIESIRKRRSSMTAPAFFQDDVRPRAWGVLVLPESSFLPTERSFPELLGIKESEAKYAYNDRIGRWIDISAGAQHIPGSVGQHPLHRKGEHHRYVFNPHDRGDRAYPRPWFDFQGPGSQGWPSSVLSPSGPGARSVSSPKSWGSPSSPHRGKHDSPHGRDYTLSSPPSSRRTPTKQQQYYHHARTGSAYKPRMVLADGSSILRTYELDIELRSSDEGGVGIMFEDAIRQTRPAGSFVPSMRVSHERLSNLIHIPELSLVVAASMCGRVALITLTRPMPKLSTPVQSSVLSSPVTPRRGSSNSNNNNGHSPGGGDHLHGGDIPFARGMKIERILPTTEDEDKRLRPMCPLLGVAASPVPSDDVRTAGAACPGRPRRYRLMLQYYDLRILSYEIGRGDDPAADGLLVM